ncbi:MAG: hypothetical protein LBS99_01805 [Clostridiales bacterium]|jgi:heme/copper-type cytochrome/quinol oxidase subunit 4|nr:hypothetical protein [Clostridiales bacterium]
MDELPDEPIVITENNKNPDAKRKTAEEKPPSARGNQQQRKKKKFYVWPIKAFIITFFLTIVFSVISESVVRGTQDMPTAANIAVMVALLIILITLNIVFDMIATAVTSCDITPFYAMASRKQKGAKTSLKLLKNSDKVSNICGDIIGDVCGIISGTAGAAIILILIAAARANSDYIAILITIAVSSIIAAVTVGGKAFFKRMAITRAERIVEVLGLALSVFPDKKNKK